MSGSSVVRVILAAGMVVGSLGLTATSVSARTYTAEEHINRDKCYRVRKVPALVEYNTRGELVQGSSRSWSGNMRKSGAIVVDRYNDEVYMTTRRVVEDQHYTLVPTKC